MYIRLKRLAIMGALLCLWVPGTQAFDVISGGGKALITQNNIGNASKQLLTDLLLTTNTAVTSETVTLSLPAGTSSLEFSTDPVAITSTNGTFTVDTLVQTASTISFNITGSGTLSVANIGLYTTNPGTTANENRQLNINFQASNFESAFFHVDTNSFAVGFGGGVQLNTAHNGTGSALRVDDLTLVASTALASEVVTVTFDDGAAFSTVASGSVNLRKTVTGSTLLDDLDGFENTDTITVNPAATTFVIGTDGSTVDQLVAFLAAQTDLSAAFNTTADTIDLSAVSDLVISSDGAMPTLNIGPAGTSTGSLDMAGTITPTDTLVSLDQFADGDNITATDSSSVDTVFTVTAVNTVNDLTTFLLGLNNLFATNDTGNKQIDLVANEDYTISSNGALSDIVLNFSEPAIFEFVPTLPNFVVTTGSLVVSNPTITANTLQFELTGSGTLELQGVDIFATNLNEKGEFFETRFLNVNAQATDFRAETFVVDTNNYGSQVALSGATGGESNNIFKIGDTISFSFAPFDYSTRFSETSLDLSAFGGDAVAAFNDPFTVIADDDDGSFTVPLTVAYSNTNVEQIYTTLNVNLDNQVPSYDFTNHNMLVLPEGKTVGGINDLLTLTFPTESSGDTITFTADFTDVAGTIANFIDQPANETQIALQEVSIDNAAYSQTIIFSDDAGNTLGPFITNQVSLDLIRPILSTANILSIDGNPIPGVIGDIVQVALPVDTVGGAGDLITYDLDLSALGGNDVNFSGASTAQGFSITAGTLNDVSFNQTLTLYDKALNSVTATTNSLQIDNAVPTFDTSCGATFQIIDDDAVFQNGIADVTNDKSDIIVFNFPDKMSAGCDFDRFSLDLRSVSELGWVFDERDANGSSQHFTLKIGSLDEVSHQIPMTIFDVNGNKQDFLTGAFNLDQDLATADQITDRSIPTSGVGTNTEILEGGTILINAAVTEEDVVGVSAQIIGASDTITLEKNSVGRWFGSLRIQPGSYVFSPKFVTYTLTDDAGNVVVLEGDKVFYITNNTTERRGGGGGSQNFSNISKKSTLQRFTPSQTKEFHDKNTAIKQKSKAQLRLESLKRRMSYPAGTPSRIVPKPESLIDQQRQGWKARQAALSKDGQPKKLQHTLEQLALPKEAPEAIAAARDDAGEFRLRSTLDNLKNAVKSAVKPVSRRQLAPNHRGKYLEVKR